MKGARGLPKRKNSSVRTVGPEQGDRPATKQKVIGHLRALSPSLVASGAIVDARASSLETAPPPRRAARASKQK